MSKPGYYEQQALMLTAYEKIRVGQDLQIDGYEQIQRLMVDTPIFNPKQLGEGIRGMVEAQKLTQTGFQQTLHAIRQADRD